MLKILMTTVLLCEVGFASLIGTSAYAADKKEATPTATPAPAESRESDKLDIKKLEQKYWSAKDDDFNVVQNRRYTKANRFFLSGNFGIPINDPFETGTISSLQLGYYRNERWGFDFNYSKASLHDNAAVVGFIDRYTSVPDRNVYQGSKMFSATYVPLYAKMSFLDTSIIYFDMGISVGIGQTDYTIKQESGDLNKTAMSYQWSVKQQIFFSEHFAAQVDLINRYTNEDRFKYYTSAPDRDLGSKSVNDTSLMFGLTYWH
jgi:outer membrane beta-barrel protein